MTWHRLAADWRGLWVKSPLTVSIVSYLITAVAFTAVSTLLTHQFNALTGLTRSVYAGVGLRGEPVLQDTTSDISLALLDDRPDLPQRFFSMRWEGFWFVPWEETIDLYVGGDDRVDVVIDGELVLRRNITEGFHTTFRTLTLSAGPHQIAIEYEQYGGGRSLHVLWAPTGEKPRAFTPDRLFSQTPGFREFWITTSATWLRRLLIVVWATPPAMLFLWIATRWAWLVLVRWGKYVEAITVRDLGQRARMVAFPALLVPTVLFVLGPHTIYATNPGEFAVSFTDLAIPWLLAVVVIAWTPLVVVGCILSDGVMRIYTSVLVGIGGLLWAQGNFFVGDYGLVDGSEIDWSHLAWRVPYEFSVWIGVLAAVIVFGRRVSRVAPFASQLFLLLQAAAIAASSFGAGGEQQVRWQEPPAAIYQFSSRQNVIHIVLDEFQSDVFGEIVDSERPWFDRRFSGFVYFADHVGAFPTTSLSMPAMLTSQVFRNERPVREFVREAFADGSIFDSLHRQGYAIDAASILPGPWLADWFQPNERAPELEGARFTIRKPFVSFRDYTQFSARQLIKFSVFRHVPHLFKAELAARPEWFERVFSAQTEESVAAERRHEASNSHAFFEQFIDQITIARDRPVYKLIHLGIPHRPVVLDENCSFVGVTTFSREAYRGQARCAVELVGEFLDRLRSLGIYDSSLLIVSSDHGTDLTPRGFFGASGSLPLRQGASTPRLTAIVGTAKAIMAIKPPGREGPLVVSEVPTTHTDLPATVFSLLSLPHRFPGQSMFHREPGGDRRRLYSMYDVRQRFPDGYLDRLDLLSIENSMLDGAGWIYRRSILNPDWEFNVRVIDLGTADATMYLGPGWSPGDHETLDGEGEVSFAWGLGQQAVVFASLPRDATELSAYLASTAEITLEVDVDGRVVGRHRFPPERDRYRRYSVRIPSDPQRPPISSVTFRFIPHENDRDAMMKFDSISFRAE